jgi:H/ACA ribonucleoprotein complex subunit 2
VKEVVKALRKSPTDTSTVPQGIVVLAADISPMDVISHIPVLCEDHGIPYIYVASRAELGIAGQTKRPTSVVLLGREVGKSKDGKIEGKEEWKETYEGLVKVVQKEGGRVKV